jgi:hypothetical protein
VPGARLVDAGADAGELPELAAAQKAVERLDVGAEAVVGALDLIWVV